MIRFTDADHKYSSSDNQPWYSVTTIISALKEKFNAEEQAPKSSKNKKSKWYGVPVVEILQAWNNERDRSTELGRWYHNKREQELYTRAGVHKPQIENGMKVAGPQQLTEGIYPEFLCYLPSARIAGQIDYLEVVGDTFNIRDYKSSKEINTKSYVNWEGISKKMVVPVNHLDDCHLEHYSLQLSIYAYIISRHNPSLKVGNLTIEHIIFEEAGQDKWGYPVYWQDENGEYIVKEIREIPVEYKKKEVHAIITWMKSNSHKLQKK
jgi:hypothetical protein